MTRKELQVVMPHQEEQTVSGGLGKATQHHCSSRVCTVHVPAMEKLSCTEVFQEVQRACQETSGLY